jgi:protein-tyrosine phosphatase
MTTILVVCTGNICRSPIAEGLLRRALFTRFGPEAPIVSSAGTAGLEGSGARPESIQVASERGAAIDQHVARALTPDLVRGADLVVGMAAEHRDAIGRADPDLAARTFTLKELVRLLEALPAERTDASAEALRGRVAEAHELRESGFGGNRFDEDVADPLGMPLESYRAIAWELEEWVGRLVSGLWGKLSVDAGERRA